jgi:hypothetical protein
VLFILYWVVAPFIAVFFAIAASRLWTEGRMIAPAPDIIAGVVSLVIRGIGTTRLFFLKRDAWIYLACSLAITSAETALNLMLVDRSRSLFSAAIPTVVTLTVSIAITTYAYRVTNQPAVDTTPLRS